MDGDWLMNPGFYKYESSNLLHGLKVLDANYYLDVENKDDHIYPVDGWYWFDSEEEAHVYFNYVPEQNDEGLEN
jgi:hypothetical protein